MDSTRVLIDTLTGVEPHRGALWGDWFGGVYADSAINNTIIHLSPDRRLD